MRTRLPFLAALALALCNVLCAQNAPVSASATGAIEKGRSVFRVQCAYCHGIDADGGFRAPSLISGKLSHGDSDDAMLNHILHGIPGTAMPANDIDEATAKDVIAYLRSQQTKSAIQTGNAANGKKLFFGAAYCSLCHMVNGSGGRLGPDLSRVGAARSPKYLAASIREPDEDLTERPSSGDFGVTSLNYELVTVTTTDGAAYSGVILNEDSFSLQFMDDHEKVHAWMKTQLKSVVHEKRSPMPKYGKEQLSDSQLDDLVAYLSSLQGRSQ